MCKVEGVRGLCYKSSCLSPTTVVLPIQDRFNLERLWSSGLHLRRQTANDVDSFEQDAAQKGGTTGGGGVVLDRYSQPVKCLPIVGVAPRRVSERQKLVIHQRSKDAGQAGHD